MLPHLAILASAGSGKTHALVTRVLRLLVLGAEPSSLTALTFTRKAAGEFTSAVLTRLAQAAGDEAKASGLAVELGVPAWTSADFLGLLQRLTAELPRLRFGTIDSFFQQVLQAGAHEMGLPGGFQLLDEAGAKEARAEVLRAHLRRAGMSAESVVHFLEAFRLATFGSEERSLLRRLERFLSDCHEAYQEQPDPSAWGDASVLFPRGCRFLPAPEQTDFQTALTAVRQWAVSTDFGHKSITKGLVDFADSLATWVPGPPLPKRGEGIRAKFLAEAGAILAGGGSIEHYKKTIHLGPAAGDLAVILGFIVGGILVQKIMMTRGLRDIIAAYEQGYAARIRSSGRLGFDDITRLVGGAHGLDLAYRLDATLQHWLLDEFQDTSRSQWRGLGHFVGETLADTTGKRSAFFVGDLKQAIYAWRGGDHRLLPELQAEHPGLGTARLDVSWRSGPAVLEMVNLVGGAIPSGHQGLPQAVRKEWDKAWGRHDPSPPRAKVSGLSRWFVYEAKDPEGEAPGEPHLDLLAALLAETDPTGRGLSCAILTRTNDDTSAVADHLRALGRTDVVAESDITVALDNPVTGALVALCQAAAHPSDRLSIGQVGLTPLSAWITGQGGWGPVRSRLLGRFAHDGAEGLVEWLLESLGTDLPADAFSQRRLDQLRGLARDFDRFGERDLTRFCRFASDSRRRESGAEKSIQVMTIHKSKGLGFDVVYVVDKSAAALDRMRPSVLLSDPAGHPPLWHLAWPPDEVCEAEDVLRAARTGHAERLAYEGLCLRYVALTRAKREITVITPKPSEVSEEGGKAFTWPQLLEHALGVEDRRVSIGGVNATLAWEAGDPLWFVAARPAVTEAALLPQPFDWGSLPKRPA